MLYRIWPVISDEISIASKRTKVWRTYHLVGDVESRNRRTELCKRARTSIRVGTRRRMNQVISPQQCAQEASREKQHSKQNRSAM